MRRVDRWVGLGLCLLLAGCGAGEFGPVDPCDGCTPDAGQPDQPDAGQPDQPDAGQPDQPDAGQPDQPDAGQPDPPDAGQPDPPDAGQPDPPDAGQADPPDAGQPDPPDAGHPHDADAGSPADGGQVPEVLPLRISSGSLASFLDAAGNTWEADRAYSGDPAHVVDRGQIPITGTDNPRLYQTERYCLTGYSLPVTAGDYHVRLHFAETFTGVTGPGQRVMDVTVEGQSAPGLDVFALTGGRNRALVRGFNVTVVDGALDVALVGVVGCAMVNGLEAHAGHDTLPPDPQPEPQAGTNPNLRVVLVTPPPLFAPATLDYRVTFGESFAGYADLTVTSGDESGRTVFSNLAPEVVYTMADLPAGTYPLRAELTYPDGTKVVGPVVQATVGFRFTEAPQPVHLTAGTSPRQTFARFGYSLGGKPGHFSDLNPAQLDVLFDRTFGDTGARLLRLWFAESIDVFVAAYAETGIVDRALARGVDEFLLAPSLIPLSFVDADGMLVRPNDYAAWLASAIASMRGRGVPITATGVMNEPRKTAPAHVTNWTGTIIGGRGISQAMGPQIVKALRSQLDARGLQAIRIVAFEESSCDQNATDGLAAVVSDPAARAALAGGATHSYNMAARADYAALVATHGLAYYQTESGNYPHEGPNEFYYPFAATAAARFLNDINFMVDNWIWFLAFNRYNTSENDNQQTLAFWKPEELALPHWYRINYQYYYVKQVARAFTPGTRIRQVLSNLGPGPPGSRWGDEMTYTYGIKPPLNAAAGRRGDGRWVFAVVNNSGDALWEQRSTGFQNSPAREYAVTLHIPELAGTGTVRFDLARSNPRVAHSTISTIDVVDGLATFTLAPHELVSVVSSTVP